MADNIGYTPGSGATIAADDISSVLYQRVKLSLGADGAAVDAVAGAGAVGTGVQRMTLASDDPAVAALADLNATEFETVAASQTDQVLGATGAAGDYLAGLLVVPATTSPGAVSIEYGATNITVFAGGTDSITDLKPFMIPLGIKAPTDGWEVTTGANVSVIAIGTFT